MQISRDIVRRWFVGALLVGAVFAGASGCSFIFDFTECEANADCESFDDPGAGEFFMCSPQEKCVVEPERQCRIDSHCDDPQTCKQGVCAD
jgi:hypothetical protein